MAYDVYSQFDLEKHKQTYVNYLEVLIDEDGTIMYAVPSHQEKAVALACARLNVSREQLMDMVPRDHYCAMNEWLCKVAKIIMVWTYGCIFDNPNCKQIGALRRLKMAGVYNGSVPKAKYYLECLHHLSPEESNVYLLGKWHIAEEGENHDGQ